MRNRDIFRPLILCLVMLMCAIVQVSAASQVIYKEELRTYTDRGYVRVGHFEVNGRTAFCMEHSNESPPTGTAVTSKIYKNEKIRKILYYGWEGPGQWSGFASQKQGITLTSLLLSETYTTAQPVGTYNFVDGLVQFRNYVNSQPAPDLDLKFSKPRVKAYYDRELDAERTEDITVQGSGAGKLTVTIPEDIILHNNKTGEEVSGTVVLVPGDSFYLRTAGSFSFDKTSEIKGKNLALQPIVFVTASTGLQDLTRLELAEDTAESTKLTVDWVGRLTLRILKKDIETGEPLAGAEFHVEKLDEDGQPTPEGDRYVTTDADGVATIGNWLYCGRKYRITEVKAPYAYALDSESKTIEVTGSNEVEEVTFNDRKQKVKIIVDKDGRYYRIESGRIEARTGKLQGAVYQVTAAEDIADWNGLTVLYKQGAVVQTIVTDENGQAVADELPPGKYSITELKAPDGYVVDREIRSYNLTVDENRSELDHKVSFINKVKTTEFRVTKYDADTKKPLANAHFRITDSEGRSIEVCTDKEGIAVVKNLPPGEYTLTEVEAPRGYRLETKSQHFTIEYEGDNADVSLTAYNHRTGGPTTGDNVSGAIILYMILFGAAVTNLAVIRIARKRMKKAHSYDKI
ncbi:MAG: hypothetical protein KBS68_02185 [Clostridiales bacterium]|nr:hypothetical protein [Candidatus Crickella merdequi]